MLGDYKMLFNLWETDDLITKFTKLYDASEREICNILFRLHTEETPDYISVFCEETGIKLDTKDISEQVEFVGKIVSTTIDDFNHLKQNGLLPIDVLLETESPISRHLKKYQIEIKPSEHTLFYRGKRLYLPTYDIDCDWCVYGEVQCRYEDKRYKNMYCPYLKMIEPLSFKLYSDKSEIEMFLYASKKVMLDYSIVKNSPEIFQTIDDFIFQLTHKRSSIVSDWTNQKQQTYIVTVNVKYRDLSYCNGFIDGKDGIDAYNLLSEYEDCCEKQYEFAENVPQCFWENIWLIKLFLCRICEPDSWCNETCAGIKHDVKLPYNSLSIEIIE